MIQAVIRNLLSNAIKFTPNNGIIKLTTQTRANDVLFSVFDNGVGVDEIQLGNLFKDGNYYSKKGTNNEGGTGLGLILCKEFIEKHGGKIWAQHKSNKETGKKKEF
ncbi:MAG: ATP-binding protein [Prolixibacteraceae bacterium]|jgi:two-component system sensor histidine kinase/response regulator|nr:ATP-binding protein [Prolixibacteraceae bacterium]